MVGRSHKAAIVIVTYEANEDKLNSIIQTIALCDCLPIVVDNSEKKILQSGSLNNNALLIPMHGNKGIAAAQNRGIDKAIDENCNIVGFFDQDSIINIKLINALLSGILVGKNNIVAPIAIDSKSGNEYPSQIVSKCGLAKDVFFKDSHEMACADVVISSGTFVNVEVFRNAGKFDEGLFIDFVDIEWCLRCKAKGYTISIVPNALMEHSIGENTKKIGGMLVSVHSPYRTYYKVRNAWLMLRKGCPKLYAIRQILSAVIKNFLLLFGQEGKSYFKYYFKGIRDGIFNKDGRYTDD